jgi:hypothetical protein
VSGIEKAIPKGRTFDTFPAEWGYPPGGDRTEWIRSNVVKELGGPAAALRSLEMRDKRLLRELRLAALEAKRLGP